MELEEDIKMKAMEIQRQRELAYRIRNTRRTFIELWIPGQTE